MITTVWRVISLRLRRGLLAETKPDPMKWRRMLSSFLSGDGIEIGPLHRPLPLEEALVSRIRYVDRLSIEDLRRHYPELSGHPFTRVDIIDDGETLQHFSETSLDFIGANHFIEHTRNPIGTIRTWAGKLRPGGIIWMSVPHKAYTFDVDRPITSMEHLKQDDLPSPAARDGRDAEHYLEYARLVDQKSGDAGHEHARKLAEAGYSIHFHTFVGSSFLEMVKYLQDELLVPINLLAYVDTSVETGEFLVLLRKRKLAAGGA